MANRGLRELRFAERGAGELQHVVIHVESDAALGVRSEQLENAAGAGADVEQATDRPLADEHVEQRALDGGLTDVQATQTLQLLGVRAAIRGGSFDTSLADTRECREI